MIKEVIPLKSKSKTITELVEYDADTGEIVRQNLYTSKSSNGKDWCIMYQMTAYLLATDDDLKFADVRVYLYLTSLADFQCKVSTTQVDMAAKLHMSEKQVIASVKKLKAKDLIRVSRVRGQSTFWINPYFITRGKNRNELLKAYEKIPSDVRRQLDVNAKIEEAAQSF